LKPLGWQNPFYLFAGLFSLPKSLKPILAKPVGQPLIEPSWWASIKATLIKAQN